MKNINKEIQNILEEQKLGVLATFNSDYQQPYSSIVAFYHSNDLSHIYFATPKTTRKYYNLKLTPNVSMLIDSRKNDGSDIGVSSAITVIGTSHEITDRNDTNRNRFQNKHSQLESFINSPSTAFICINVTKYVLVNRFQDVLELKIK